MARKGEIVKELYKSIALLAERPSKTIEEIAVIGDNMPVSWMKDPKLLSKYVVDNGLNLEDASAFVNWILSLYGVLDKIEAEEHVTYAEFSKAYDAVMSLFIIIHRVNYVLRQTMIDVYDLLEREHRMRFKVKRCHSQAEACWERYIRPYRLNTERMAWSTMMDHLDLSHAAVQPMLEDVYVTLRDYMIRLGWRDVELKARSCIVLLMGKVAGASFERFFLDLMQETGINFKRCFEKADLRPMVKMFVQMMDGLGITTTTDADGYYTIADFQPDNNQRFKTAWKVFMEALRDDEIIEDAAKQALELNPKACEAYKYVLEQLDKEEEEKKKREMEEGFKMLEKDSR